MDNLNSITCSITRCTGIVYVQWCASTCGCNYDSITCCGIIWRGHVKAYTRFIIFNILSRMIKWIAIDIMRILSSIETIISTCLCAIIISSCGQYFTCKIENHFRICRKSLIKCPSNKRSRILSSLCSRYKLNSIWPLIFNLISCWDSYRTIIIYSDFKSNKSTRYNLRTRGSYGFCEFNIVILWLWLIYPEANLIFIILARISICSHCESITIKILWSSGYFIITGFCFITWIWIA